MIDPIFQRAELMLGEEAMKKLSQVRVIVFGVGGVGSWCAEGLVRTGQCEDYGFGTGFYRRYG